MNTALYKMIKNIKKGFTLIEVLIVIALIASLAVVVIAAINPVEQANRSRDTRYATETADVVKAVERYFASQGSFPWVAVDSATYDNTDDFGYVNATTEEVGICGSSCANDGVLITSEELRSDFLNKGFVTATDVADQIVVGKDTGSNESVYACYIPLSKAAKEKAIADANVWTVDGTGGRVAGSTASGGACDPAAASWTTCYVCVP